MDVCAHEHVFSLVTNYLDLVSCAKLSMVCKYINGVFSQARSESSSAARRIDHGRVFAKLIPTWDKHVCEYYFTTQTGIVTTVEHNSSRLDHTYILYNVHLMSDRSVYKYDVTRIVTVDDNEETVHCYNVGGWDGLSILWLLQGLYIAFNRMKLVFALVSRYTDFQSRGRLLTSCKGINSVLNTDATCVESRNKYTHARRFAPALADIRKISHTVEILDTEDEWFRPQIQYRCTREYVCKKTEYDVYMNHDGREYAYWHVYTTVYAPSGMPMGESTMRLLTRGW